MPDARPSIFFNIQKIMKTKALHQQFLTSSSFRMAACIFADLQTVACNEQQISMVLACASWKRSLRRLRRQHQWHDRNQKCLTCRSKRSCINVLICFVVLYQFLRVMRRHHEVDSVLAQGLWNLTPSSAATQPNKPRMFMTMFICLS